MNKKMNLYKISTYKKRGLGVVSNGEGCDIALILLAELSSPTLVGITKLMAINNKEGLLSTLKSIQSFNPFNPRFRHKVYDCRFIVNRKLRSLLWYIVVQIVHDVNQTDVTLSLSIGAEVFCHGSSGSP